MPLSAFGRGTSLPIALPPPDLIKIIFDTDTNGDTDDTGDAAMLAQLANDGHYDIAACIASYWNDAAVDAIDVVLTHMGQVPEFGYGAIQGTIPPGHGDPGEFGNYYMFDLSEDYSHPHTNGRSSTTAALTVYRTALAGSPNQSIKIIQVGGFTCLSELLDSPPDAISPLNGEELIEAKVVELLCGSGVKNLNGDGQETNIMMDPAASSNVCANWPTLVTWSFIDDVIGTTIGNDLTAEAPGCPIGRAYQIAGFAGLPYSIPCFEEVIGSGLYTYETGKLGVNAITGRCGWNTGLSGHRCLVQVPSDATMLARWNDLLEDHEA